MPGWSVRLDPHLIEKTSAPLLGFGAEAVRGIGDYVPVSLSGRTISRLSAPFEGGNGPSHGVIENIWLGEDAPAYLPDAGNKAERVRGGLKALRDGRSAGPNGPGLLPDHERLKRVAEELSERLLSAGYMSEADLPELFGDTSAVPPSVVTARPTVPPADAFVPAPIFMVHGHDHALLHQSVRVLEKGTSRAIVVLHEQPNSGRTLIEKFEDHASVASFAVVLLTPDDAGGAQGAPPTARARQNVIFELGFFFGRLGRDRVAVLLAPGVEQPSDIAGLVYISADQAGAWRYELLREIEAGGIPVDRSRIP